MAGMTRKHVIGVRELLNFEIK